MKYISARETADKWGISQRRVATLCAESRVPYASMVGNMWIIPENATKPSDARHIRYTKQQNSDYGKPFLKWAGGKGQLLKEIAAFYPFEKFNITKYAEPFVGGGAVLFDILNKYTLDEVYINDINYELINTYRAIKETPYDLIEILQHYQDDFTPLEQEQRKDYFAIKRNRFNELKSACTEKNKLELAALMIFLNKTCFNGLYRVNKKGQYNVPMGKYKAPLICDEKNIKILSNKLKCVNINYGSYKNCLEFVDAHTFVYFDPPYRPLTDTASFTSYTEGCFNDDDQKELAELVNMVDQKEALFLLSNSDPKNTNKEDNFFDDLYADYNIKRIQANRMINSKASGRGRITEILVSNF